MLFLLDSNIAIKSDPLSTSVEPDAELAMEFHRLATTQHHDLRVHPSSLLDFDRITDEDKRAARLTVFKRYEKLASPPAVTSRQTDALGVAEPGSNDEVDQHLLAAVVGNACGYLVTEDQGLHAKARLMGVEDRVLLLADAVALLTSLFVPLPDPPPAVRLVKAHELFLEDPIFDSLRADYTDFENWFIHKVARAARDAFLIDGDGSHAAICILKDESAGEYGLMGPLLKLSTFKVEATHSGQKYGELLLKAVFEHARAMGVKGIYVTVFDRHQQLVALFEDFGFRRIPMITVLGEAVYAKSLVPDGLEHSALEYHVLFGPPALQIDGTQPCLVPIEPRWHRALFPDAEPVGGLFSEQLVSPNHAFGNALRKAYLCNASTRLLEPGDPLLFYRSHDEKAVYVVGVCERTLVSRDPLEIAATVGRRTVYSFEEIEQLTSRGEVLVVMFRQDRVLRGEPITLSEILGSGLARSWPQTIGRVRKEGIPWLKERLGE